MIYKDIATRRAYRELKAPGGPIRFFARPADADQVFDSPHPPQHALSPLAPVSLLHHIALGGPGRAAPRLVMAALGRASFLEGLVFDG